MIGRLAAKLAVFLLKNSRISIEERQLLTAVILDRLGALPIHAKVVIDELGGIFIDGKPLTLEAARHVHESAKALVKNFAYKVVREQISFMAVHKGVHENVSPEQGLFAKAALWVLQEQHELYLRFSQVEGAEDAQ